MSCPVHCQKYNLRYYYCISEPCTVLWLNNTENSLAWGKKSDKNVKELQNEDRLKKKEEKGMFLFFFTGELIAPSSVQEEEC